MSGKRERGTRSNQAVGIRARSIRQNDVMILGLLLTFGQRQIPNY